MRQWLSCKICSHCLCCGQYQSFTMSQISFKDAILLRYYRANGFLEVILNIKSPHKVFIFYFFLYIFNFLCVLLNFHFNLF